MISRKSWSTMIFLFFMTSWVYAGNITVNSLRDTNARDNAITLREAILLSEGDLTFGSLTSDEQTQVIPPVGRGVADTIDLSIYGVIMLTSGLPSITDDGTVIDASSQWNGVWPGGQPGVILDGKNAGNAHGLEITGAGNCHIRGLFITHFARIGVVIDSGSQLSTIGGTGAGWRNIISGNFGDGVAIFDSGTNNNVISGNYIGTDVTGTAVLGNSASGISIGYGPRSNIIGGIAPGERNIISGNDNDGVFISDSATHNVVSGNYIGTDVTGTADVGNSEFGVFICCGAQSNIIGGTTAGEGNIISGNGGNGLWIGGSGTDKNVVSGNYIGVDVTGSDGLGNSSSGIEIQDGAKYNNIGGATPGERNVISGNDGFGIVITGSGTTNNMVKGNYIGTDVSGMRDLGNDSFGVLIVDGAQSNIIGGTAHGEGNVIAFSKNRAGVFVVDDNTDFNTISGNSIHDNAWLGIDLREGGNDGIAPPDIICYCLAGDTLTISGDTMKPNATIEVFKADPRGEEGETFLGSLTVDRNGELSGTLSVAGKGISEDDALIATITDTNGNTSEYTRPFIWTKTATKPPVPVLVNIDGRKLSVGEGGILYHDGKPFRAVGVNSYDVFDRTLSEPNNTSYRWAFAQLALHGIPFTRFMATTHWPVNLAIYVDDKEAYFKRLDGVIQAAEEYGIGLIPSFFHSWTIPDLVGEPLNQWGNPDSKTIAFMRQYTRDIVFRYKDSPAIWVWEFGGELNLAADLRGDWRPPVEPELGTPLTRGPEDDLTTDMIVVAFREFAEVVRSIDPTRPITTGNACSRPNAEDMRLCRGCYELDTRDEFKANLSLVTPSPCDMMSIHIGDEAFYERFEPGYYPSYDDLVSLAMEASVQNGKALFVGEMSVSDYTYGIETAAPLMQEMLDAVVEYDVPLAAIWGFDMPVSDDDSTDGRNIRPPNTRMYLLEAIRNANAAISAKLGGDQYTNYPWDVNRDGKVDVLDLVFVARYIGKNVTSELYFNPDVNGDGIVNILDIILVARHFGEAYSPN